MRGIFGKKQTDAIHLFYTICGTVLVTIFKAGSIKEGSVNCDLLISALNN